MRQERRPFTCYLIRVMLSALKFGEHLLNNCLVLFQAAVETQGPPHPVTTVIDNVSLQPCHCLHALSADCHFKHAAPFTPVQFFNLSLD